ncbi:MAG: T9SS type A sorting domain-containing protein, partial [Bacteroidota bacterium]
ANDNAGLEIALNEGTDSSTVGLTNIYGSESGITLQPNPNNGQFYLHGLNRLKGEIKLDILQPDGKVIHSEIVNNKDNHLLNLKVEAGIYICRITNSEIKTLLKFVAY